MDDQTPSTDVLYADWLQRHGARIDALEKRSALSLFVALLALTIVALTAARAISLLMLVMESKGHKEGT